MLRQLLLAGLIVAFAPASRSAHAECPYDPGCANYPYGRLNSNAPGVVQSPFGNSGWRNPNAGGPSPIYDRSGQYRNNLSASPNGSNTFSSPFGATGAPGGQSNSGGGSNPLSVGNGR